MACQRHGMGAIVARSEIKFHGKKWSSCWLLETCIGRSRICIEKVPYMVTCHTEEHRTAAKASAPIQIVAVAKLTEMGCESQNMNTGPPIAPGP
jgi:hypothetical protein